MSRPVKVYFDGGCRPNPGAMEIAVVAAGETLVLRDLGHGSSSDAEWLALLRALRLGQAMGRDFVLIGDSADVVAKASGRVKPGGDAHHLAAYREAAGGAAPKIRHVKRSHNLAGIALARLRA